MVVLHRIALAASVSAIIGVANAALEITTPGPNAWWGMYDYGATLRKVLEDIDNCIVAASQNVLTWTCQDSPAQQFTILCVFRFILL
jgi:hypothetical protein